MNSEDKKRKFDDNDDPELQPSKKPLQSLSTQGPLTQQDVVYYKKEAIWRQMRFYKLQAVEVKSELQRYETRYKAFVASHLLLEGWYSTVVKAMGEQPVEELNLASISTTKLEGVLAQRQEQLVNLFKVSGITSEDALAKLADFVTLEAERNEARTLQVTLENKLASLEAQIAELQMAKDRFESATIKRVQVNNKQKIEESEATTNGNPTEDSPKLDTESSGVSAEQASADKQELECLKVEFELMKAGLATLTETLKSANAKLLTAEQSNSQLSQALTNLNEPELLNSAKYVNLLSQNKSLNETNSQLLKLKEELVARLGELEEKQSSLLTTVSSEITEENKHLKELLAKAETDLARVRAVRDELIGKQAVLRLELEQTKPSSEAVALIDTLNQRLHKLEERLSAEYSVEADAKLEALDKPDLIKHLQILSAELKDLETAFQETRNLALDKLKDSTDKDGLVKKLTVEKTKADQKYFASMRVKDLLSAENKILKSQITKSQELVLKHSDIEKTYVAKIDLLNKSLNELRAIKESSIRENSKLYDSVKGLTRSREGAVKEISQLKEELGALSKAKESLVEECSDLKYTYSKLQGKLKATENLLQKYKSNNTSSILQEDEKQLEALRSITKCSVCSKNWKNMAITACGHVFCDGCVQERLNARLRRCPTCNKGFSANDLLAVHL